MKLRPGDVVRVRSAAEIATTLDADGTCEGMPFMPEMLAWCGQRLRVQAVAHKTCDTITKTGGRRLRNAVHLEGVRCDGAAHGGCQAACLIFWKTAWLERMRRDEPPGAPAPAPSGTRDPRLAITRRDDAADDDARYVCQATELLRATEPLRWWDLRQYVLDLWYGNVGPLTLVRVVAIAAFNALQRRRGGRQYPFAAPARLPSPPPQRLHLVPGDRVRIRPREEIRATLDDRGRNRGLWFDTEMVPYCGGTYRVEARVERIIEERTGKMLHLANDCIRLEGVVCQGHWSQGRLFCPRAITSYWREVWLERAGDGAVDG